MTGLLIRATLLFLAGLIVLRIARHATAALRHAVCLYALAGSLILPAALFLPSRVLAIRLPAIPAFAAPGSFAGATRAHLAAVLPAIVFAVWLAVALAFVARLAIGYVRLARIARKAAPWREAKLADITVPIAAGFFHPTVLMPRSAPDWPEWQWTSALRHELAHIERKDLLANLIAHLARAIYWFHPLAWALARRLRAEQESACDDAVLASGFAPAIYAKALLVTAQQAGTGLLTGCSMITKSNLKKRIARLLDGDIERKPSFRALRGVGVAFAALLIALSVSGSGQADQVYKVGNGVSQPRVIRKVDPQYTKEARRKKIDGTVLLTTVIGSNGRARDIIVTKRLEPGLDANAVAAVKKWRFAPGTLNGQPVAVRATIEVNFRLK